MAKIRYNAEIELEITNRVFEKAVEIEKSVQARYQDNFKDMHKYLNWIMDCSVMYDENQLDMANNAIKANRQWATQARTILRRMMKQ